MPSSKHSTKTLFITTIAFFITTMVFLATTAYLLLNKPKVSKNNDNLNTYKQQTTANNNVNPTTTTPTQTTVSQNKVIATKPSTNTVYYVNYNNEPALFFIPGQNQDYKGTVVLGDGTSRTQILFTDVSEPVELIKLNYQGEYINNFLINSTTLVYVVEGTNEQNSKTSFIYKTDLNTYQTQQIWENDHRSGESFGIEQETVYDYSAILSNIFNNNYITVNILGEAGYSCGEYCGYSKIIINMQNKQHQKLGFVGNVNVNTNNNTVSYQNLSTRQVPCEPSPLCIDGTINEYYPTGQTLSKNLP